MGLRIPVVGIAAGRRQFENYTFQQAGDPYIEALVKAGACPLILPATPKLRLVSTMLDRIDAVLLPGGGDVSPRIYGKRPSVALGVDETTDRFEMELCREAADRDIPLLAVCRGIQVLNVAFGGTLVQDIPTELNTSVNHRQAASRDTCTHGILIEPETLLARVTGQTEFEVNSFHHQAIDSLGRGLIIAARSREDGIIEGVERPESTFFIGVQFHPEEICRSERPMANLFEALVSASQAHHPPSITRQVPVMNAASSESR